MGHAIYHHTYPVTMSQQDISNEIGHNHYWESEGKAPGKIRFIDVTLPNYEAALEYIEKHDRHWYDNLAVKYKAIPDGKTSKKLETLRAKLSTTYTEYRKLNESVPAKDFKAEFVGCRHCGSKISKKYIKSNYCPVCGKDMRSETLLKRLQTMQEKCEKLRADIKTEEHNLAEKYGKLCWLVKIEYHV